MTSDSSSNIKELKEAYEVALARIAKISPYFGSLILRCRVYAHSKQRSERLSAQRDTAHAIHLYPSFLALRIDEQCFVLLHEFFHILFLHLKRSRPLVHKYGAKIAQAAGNYAGDVINNEMLIAAGFRPPEGVLRADDLPFNVDLNNAIFEELAEQIAEYMKKNPSRMSGIDSSPAAATDDEVDMSDAVTLNEGSENIYGKGGDERDEAWKDALQAALIAGDSSLGQLLDIKILTSNQVDWRSVLRWITSSYPLKVLSDWRREHRKYPEYLPHFKKIGRARIFALVDTSGSVQDVLPKFMGELMNAARVTDVIVVPWDVEVYPPFKLDSRMKGELKGEGGTEITKALQFIAEKAKFNDAVVVLTDGEIGDKSRAPWTQVRSRVKYVFTTHKRVDAPTWREVRIKL